VLIAEELSPATVAALGLNRDFDVGRRSKLDGGGTAKANSVGTEPTADQVRLGMKVRLTTFPVGTDRDGTQAIAFGYEPA